MTDNPDEWPESHLPDEDGIPRPHFHFPQACLLSEVLGPVVRAAHPDGRYIVGANSGIYWSLTPEPLDGCKAPSWYYVPNVYPNPGGRPRRYYEQYREFQPPRLLVEFVREDGSEEHDMTENRGKMWVYEQRIRAEHFFIFDQPSATLEAFQLDATTERFVPIAANERGHFPVAPMGIELGVWQGEYKNDHDAWLRAWDANGELVPTKCEELRELVAEREHRELLARVERMREQLRRMGIDPDTI